jgi:hypothetical protein
MDRIVICSEHAEPGALGGHFDRAEIIPVYSQLRFVECLVDDPALVAAAIRIDTMTDQWAQFLESVSQSFPLLPVLVVRPAGGPPSPDAYPCLDATATAEEIAAGLRSLIDQRQHSERREHHRFEWPLRGMVVGGDGTFHRISEIGAGGAYLEPVGARFDTGQSCVLEIHFRNFKMQANCVILDPRHMSSTRSNGFGVRFVDLSDESSAFIDRIVHDALVEVLTDPGSRPEIPALDDPDELLSVGDEFSLT